MEQTSSAAYPNVLVADYVKKARVANPQILMKAEQHLNVGYQKLLTFERPGGGFDWWGNGEPLVWLSANALAAYDPKDDSTLEAVRKLDKLRKEIPEWKAVNFPGKGMSLTYAHGDGVTVETTALAALAMIRTGEFTNDANQALTYLI